ncbi:MAG: phosphate ABC transporter substrate-binding protein, partial [Armatimonadetes bacterium]|nr:phosphate ABC transporter substrate-binding protein [Armatimonadota bacterium]
MGPSSVWSRTAAAVLLVVCLAGLPACRPSQRGGLTVAGSTSVQPIAELLAERYMATRPGAVVSVQGGGSSAGIRAALSGAAEIGMSSRELKPDETGLEEFVMARDAIALIVHPSNPVQALTTEQARGIFSGRFARWEQVGGEPGEITFITREEGSGTRGAFEEMVMGEETEIAPEGIVQDSTGAARAIVAGDPNAIAYISLGMATPEVRVVALDGVAPTEESAADGSYPLTRPFLLLTKGRPTSQAQAFLDFLMAT